MQLVPARVPFLAAITADRPAAIILGAPLDITESFRDGTREGPDRIREVSDILETYSPVLGVDLSDLPLADWGNLVVQGSMETALADIADAAEAAARTGLPLILGGEHTITVGAVRGVRRVHHGLVVVHVDAHLDLRDEYEGERCSHATVMRRVAEDVGIGQIAQFGIRSGTRDEFALARGCLTSQPTLEIDDAVRRALSTRPVYLSIDIDVLDPSCAPGTGCPEPGGASFDELLRFIYSLRGLRVVAADITEVLPGADVNDITSAAAAKIIREVALAFAPRKAW
jgi:agmatinase